MITELLDFLSGRRKKKMRLQIGRVHFKKPVTLKVGCVVIKKGTQSTILSVDKVKLSN